MEKITVICPCCNIMLHQTNNRSVNLTKRCPNCKKYIIIVIKDGIATAAPKGGF